MEHNSRKHTYYRRSNFFLKAALLTMLTVVPIETKTEVAFSNSKTNIHANKYALYNRAQRDSCIELFGMPLEQMTEKEKACELFNMLCHIGLSPDFLDLYWDRLLAMIDEAIAKPSFERAVIRELQFYGIDANSLFSDKPKFAGQESIFEKDGKEYYISISDIAIELRRIMTITCFFYLPSSLERKVVLPKINRFLMEELHSDIRLDESFFSDLAKDLNICKTMEKTGLEVEDQVRLLKFLMRRDFGLISRNSPIFVPITLDAQILKELGDREKLYPKKTKELSEIERVITVLCGIFTIYYLMRLAKNHPRRKDQNRTLDNWPVSDRMDSRYGIDGPPPQNFDWY